MGYVYVIRQKICLPWIRASFSHFI